MLGLGLGLGLGLPWHVLVAVDGALVFRVYARVRVRIRIRIRVTLACIGGAGLALRSVRV